MKKISVIGAGNMGGTLVKGWITASRRGNTNLCVTAANSYVQK